MENKFEVLCASVLNTIRNKATKTKPISAHQIRTDLGINRRNLQKILFELRKEYPIVAREAYPCGYYLATNEDDIVNFTQLLQTHINGHENTLKLMNAFLADYGSIPYID